MPSTSQSIVVPAPIAEVWTRLSNFHDFSWAPNVITHVEQVGDVAGNEAGAKRILNQVFHETLIEIDGDRHLLRYSIDDGPSPVAPQDVSNYIGSIRLNPDPDSGGTLVEWNSAWDSNSDDAVEFCHGIYVALLQSLAKSFQQ
ncbi:MAG: SRPBCC family protein [Gammaproteobacteria bacterium]|nr:SRPBCC family protein [Gammaproteobacteria bacterium]